jgi:hypothetical protein
MRISTHTLRHYLLKVTRGSSQTVATPSSEQIIASHYRKLKPLLPGIPETVIEEAVMLTELMKDKEVIQSCNIVPGSLAALVAVIIKHGSKLKLSAAINACGLSEQKTLCYLKFKFAKDLLPR